MDSGTRQPVWNTTLATVTALGTLVGAVGGLIATVYALGSTGSGDALAPVSPSPSAVTAALPSVTPSPAPTVRLTASPAPSAIALDPGADRWWGPPGASFDDDDDETPGETSYLALDWGCSDDSRGNGAKEDCGSGLVAVYFSLADLPDGATIEEAVLTLYSDDGPSGTVYVRLAASWWSEEDSSEPDCDSSGQVAAEADGDEWTWDITSLVETLHRGEEDNFGFCLVLKENDDALTFVSREGATTFVPVLTITYR